MPCSAAAAVTSGSLAAPSSIEYSVCTCRCANESVLLTGGGAPQWSCVPRPGCSGRRPVGKTGGRSGGCVSRVAGVRCPDPRTRRGLLRGSDRTCLVTGGPQQDPCPHLSQARGGALQGGASQPPDHRHVDDARLLVLVADGDVTGPLVEAPRRHLGVQFHLGHPAQDGLPV